MFRKTILAAAVAAAAGIAAALIYSLSEKKSSGKEDDDEVNFIDIADGSDSEEDVADKPQKFEQQKPEEDDGVEYAPEVSEIAGMYPYLKKAFIAEQYGRNDAFMTQYPEDTLITIIHKAKFEDADTLKSFNAIAEANGFTSEAISDTEGTVSRKMFTEDGAILSDIYNVANQVACLRGTYEGYSIL